MLYMNHKKKENIIEASDSTTIFCDIHKSFNFFVVLLLIFLSVIVSVKLTFDFHFTATYVFY